MLHHVKKVACSGCLDELLEEDEAGGPSRDIDTQVLFVDNPQKSTCFNCESAEASFSCSLLVLEFVIGKPISMLTSFVNRGDRSFNITRFGAHLHSPYDYSYFIQNVRAQFVACELHVRSLIPDHESSVCWAWICDVFCLYLIIAALSLVCVMLVFKQ